jgi:hypothetical protein
MLVENFTDVSSRYALTTDMDNPSRRRLVENEVIFRSANQDAQQYIAETRGMSAQIQFYCECSHLDCGERIRISVRDYEACHQNKRQFIALEGHEKPEIERIVERRDGFNTIEKFSDPPSRDEIKAALKDIKTL